jgi:hypothetical protein
VVGCALASVAQRPERGDARTGDMGHDTMQGIETTSNNYMGGNPLQEGKVEGAI